LTKPLHAIRYLVYLHFISCLQLFYSSICISCTNNAAARLFDSEEVDEYIHTMNNTCLR
jgi:hypothetical protein